jgi:drug/metabolite transporter (DMT)-like permease
LFPYVTLVYGAATVVLGGAVLAAEAPFSYPPREFALFAAMAVGPGLLGHTVLNWALEHVESSVVSVTLLGEPVGSTVLAVFLLGEVPVTLTLVGGGTVLGGIYLATVARESGADRRDPDPDTDTDTDTDTDVDVNVDVDVDDTGPTEGD